MALITRRHFARQMAFAAALCGLPAWAIGESHWLFDADKQNGAPPDPQTIRKLASQIVGQVITPEAADYDAARSIFNRAYDRRPAVIVRCGSPSDVARALDFAQTQHLPLAVRAGGHSRLGFGMCDGGVVIDLSAMKRVEVDISKRVARAEAGALVRDLDTATQHFGLATTSGGCPTVGIAGFTLGGGEGRLMEKYGAACDNLLSAQVVTVDGRQVEGQPEVQSRSFLGDSRGRRQLRCGHGAGVPAPSGRPGSVGSPHLSAGTHSRSPAGFRQVSCWRPRMKWTRLPRCCHPNRAARFKVDVCYCGDPRMGNDLLRPLRAFKPQDDSVKVMSYLEAQAAGGFLAAPVAHFQTNLFLRELSGAAIAAITTAINDAPATCKVIIVPLRGAVSRVSVTDTAFALREPGYEIDMAGVWNTPAVKAEVVRWVQATRDNLQPFAHGVYVNQLGDTSDQLVRSGYGPNYARLVEIKKKYDPNNVLRLNQNIKPNSASKT